MKNIILSISVSLIISCTGSNHKPYTVNDTIPFSSTKWKSGDMYQKGIMVDDLLKNHKLIGLKRTEIFELLGRPTGFQNQNFDPETPAEQDTMISLCYFAFPPYLSEYQPYALMCIKFDSLDQVEWVSITD
jgi:hypothetical protein